MDDLDLVGKRVLVKKGLRSEQLIDGFYFCDDMLNYRNKYLTVRRIRRIAEDYTAFYVEECGDYTFTTGMIEHIILNVKTEDESENVNYSIGDLVETINVAKVDEKPIDTFKGVPILGMLGKAYGEKRKLIIRDIKDGVIYPYFIDGKKYNAEPITVDCIKLIESNYLQRIKDKKRKTQNDKRIIDDIETINEMLTKVDVKSFKKIYAGSLGYIPKDIKGVELLLNQWAFNKKHIYRMFGRQLDIEDTINYRKVPEDMEQDRVRIYNEFPGTYYFFKRFSNEELLNNELRHTEDGEWTNYSRVCKRGEKISGILSDAFKCDKLTTFFSDIIAQTTLKGKIVVSINPIEYLLMSCNKSGWSSCHTIYKFGSGTHSFGCYSAGIFSYMCDEVSLISFRYDGNLYDYRFSNQRVQEKSKTWRQMIWIRPDFKAFIASRQYPRYIDEVAKDARELLEKYINSYLGDIVWVHTSNKEKMQSVVCNKDDNIVLHYNDILCNYSGDMCYEKSDLLPKNSIEVGSNPICPKCGKYILTNCGTPYCRQC